VRLAERQETPADRKAVAGGDHVIPFNSVKDVLDWTKDVISMEEEDDEFFIIGGGEIFHQFYPHVDRLYVTHIDHDFEGKTQWDGFKWSDWRLVSSEKGPNNDENPYDYWFSVYERGGNIDAPRLR
jgi:dihydrofolate reductase